MRSAACPGCTICSVEETGSRDWGRDVVDLLEDAALVHESEGRAALAKHHRRVARALRPVPSE